MNKEKNSVYLKLLMFPYLLFTIGNIVFLWFVIFMYFIGFNQWDISGADVFNARVFISVLVFLISFFSFIKDRVFLKKNGFYCPSWVWFVFPPLYIYKRQKYNDSGFEYFWVFIFINLFLPLYNQGILMGIITITLRL